MDNPKKPPAAIRKLLPHDGMNLGGTVPPRKRVRPEEDDEEEDDEEDEEEEEPDEKLPPLLESAPRPKRSIIENDGLSELIGSLCVCKRCRKVGGLSLAFPSAAVATTPALECTNCNWTEQSTVSMTQLERSTRGKKKVTDCACDVLFVVSFIASGDGGTEAQRVMGLSGLPHIQSMEKDAFNKIEKAISPALKKPFDEVLGECLQAEVKECMAGDPDFDFEKWKNALENKTACSKEEFAELMVSMDMGWQCRGSGRRFNSLSGHAFLVGLALRLPAAFCLKTRGCLICDQHDDVDDIPPHDNCAKNHDGSAGSMEPAALLEMTKTLHLEKLTNVTEIVTDDDSTMRAQTKWSNDDCKANCGVEPPRIPVGTEGKTKARKGGKLPGTTPEPRFLADPAHRKKILRSRLCVIKNKRKAERHGMNEGDIIRIATNFICMANQLPLLDRSEWVPAGKAVLEHHFDEHKCCGEFCLGSKELEEKKKNPQSSSSQPEKFHRSKTKDADLHLELKEMVDELVAMDGLKEIGHGHDTNVNEASNNIISWLAPKNKTHCHAGSLTNRIAIAVSIFCVGCKSFYTRLFAELGIEMDDSTLYYVQLKERQRQVEMQKSKTFEAKRKRNGKLHLKLKQHAEAAMKDRQKGDGHATGTALSNDKGAERTDDANAAPSASLSELVCRSCGEVGHKTSDNRRCKNFKPRQTKKRKQSKEDCNEQSMFDCIPLHEEEQNDRSKELVKEVGRLLEKEDESDDQAESTRAIEQLGQCKNI